MNDYTSGKGLLDEETLAHFVAGSDPISFDEAIKSAREKGYGFGD